MCIEQVPPGTHKAIKITSALQIILYILVITALIKIICLPFLNFTADISEFSELFMALVLYLAIKTQSSCQCTLFLFLVFLEWAGNLNIIGRQYQNQDNHRHFKNDD